MTQILASGKTGAQRYANNDLSKPVAALDMIQIGQQTQRASEETLGWSYSNEEGSADSQPSSSLKPITAANVGDYDPYLAQIIQTYVANNSYLECSGTANAISLAPRKIADIASPDTTNYSKATSLPFTFRDNLRFTFRATNTNTAATQITIPALAGLSGSIDVVDEAGADLVGGEIIAGKFYEIITTGTSGTKKVVLKNTKKPVLFKVGPAINQTIAASTATKVVLGTEIYDTHGYFYPSTSRFTPLTAGYYKFDAACYVSLVTAASVRALLYINGVQVGGGSFVVGPASAQDATSILSNLIYMNGSTDYAELYVIQYSTDGSETLTATATYFSAFLIS